MNQKGLSSISAVLIVVVIAVGLMGYLYFMQQPTEQPDRVESNSERQIDNLPPAQPTVPNKPAEKKSETATWKAYRNDEYGFEFKYPVSFLVEYDTAGYIVVRVPNVPTPRFPINELTISEIRERGSLTLEQFVHDDGMYESSKNVLYNDEKIFVTNGIQTYTYAKVLGSHSQRHVFFLLNESRGVHASYVIASVEGDNAFQKDFDKILSTFKFIR